MCMGDKEIDAIVIAIVNDIVTVNVIFLRMLPRVTCERRFFNIFLGSPSQRVIRPP